MRITKDILKLLTVSSACFLALTVILIVVACINTDTDRSTDNGGILDVFAEQHQNAWESGEDNDSQITQPSVFDGFLLAEHENSYTLVSVKSPAEKDLIIPDNGPSGKPITSISDSAFSMCNSTQTVTLPSTIKSIGLGCFAGCSSLEAIYVDYDSKYFSSVGGVLFNKERTELICYPSARVGRNYLLGTGVKRISPYAFDGVRELGAILYEGSTAKYQMISIGEGNSVFSALPVTCNYVPAKK